MPSEEVGSYPLKESCKALQNLHSTSVTHGSRNYSNSPVLPPQSHMPLMTTSMRVFFSEGGNKNTEVFQPVYLLEKRHHSLSLSDKFISSSFAPFCCNFTHGERKKKIRWGDITANKWHLQLMWRQTTSSLAWIF